MWDQFFSELKRRRVIRVAGVYAVTCWAIFQVVAALFPVLRLPAWTVTLAAVLLILGFPIALIISWAFETAEGGGVRRTRAVRKGDAPAKVGWGDWALMAAAVAILGVAGAQMLGVIPNLAGARGTRTAAAAAPQKSVAVLPFANFSSQRDSELFADGMTEEVINGLAQIPELKVAGRTSAFYFKGRNDDLRVIGNKLGVSHVLEGSIRQDGPRLRVTVQLIKVSDGFHVWSETYDRTMDDAFAIQTEISEKVAAVLKTKLDLNGPNAAPIDPAAYSASLVARAQMRRLGLEELTAARAGFKKLIDAGNATGATYAGYAQSTMLLAQDHLALDFNEADRESAAAIAKAVALDPRSPEVLTAQGFHCLIRNIRMSDQACLPDGEKAFAAAAQLAPRDPDVLVNYANFLIRRGDPAQGLALLRRAVELDPLNRVALMLMAGAAGDLGRFEEAERGYRQIIDLYPDFVSAKQDLGTTFVSEGKLDQAEPWLRAAAEPGTDPAATLELANLYLNLGMTDRFNATIERMREPALIAQIGVAVRKVVGGDYPAALTYVEARYNEDHDPLWTRAMIDLANLSGDNEKARRVATQISPQFFAPDPKVDRSLASDATSIALVLDRLGDKDQARRICLQVLAATAPRPGVPPRHGLARTRARAYALMGDNEHALAELKGAVDTGYRSLWDYESWLRLDAEPHFATLKGDPRFQALVRQIETDNARMRAALLAKGAV